MGCLVPHASPFLTHYSDHCATFSRKPSPIPQLWVKVSFYVCPMHTLTLAALLLEWSSQERIPCSASCELCKAEIRSVSSLGLASLQCSIQCLPCSKTQGMILERMAGPNLSIHGSLGSDLVHVLLSVPLTQLLWVLGLLCTVWYINPWVFCQAALNLIASSNIDWL